MLRFALCNRDEGCVAPWAIRMAGREGRGKQTKRGKVGKNGDIETWWKMMITDWVLFLQNSYVEVLTLDVMIRVPLVRYLKLNKITRS